jgi:competence protein ComEC
MIIVAFILGWLAGMGAAAQVSLFWHAWALAGLAAVILAVLTRRSRYFLIFIALGGAGLGAGRYQLSQALPGPGHVALYNDGEMVTLYGRIAAPPRVRDRYVSAVLDVTTLSAVEDQSGEAHGLVQVQAPRFLPLHYGDWITATGRLQTPRPAAGFDYQAYLARRDIYSEIPFPVVETVPGAAANPLRRALFQLRERAATTIDRLLPDPQAALLQGILLGDDAGIPLDLQEAFRISGTSHIIAISGFNIAILAGLLLRVVIPLAGPRWAIWPALAVIAIYTLLVGADSSVVRAAIMGGLYLLAGRWLGRTLLRYAGLLLAAFTMTAVRPTVLWDAGFQLSFAATLGLLLYAEPLNRRARALIARWVGEERAGRFARLLGEGVIVTLAAQLTTLPLLLYHFRQLSLFSPLANLLILPAQPGVMIWGGLATLSGLLWQPLGQILAPIAWLFLTYTIAIATWFASLPFAAVSLSLTPAGVAVAYLLLAAITWLAASGWRPALGKARTQAPRLALVAVAALALVTWQWVQTRPDGRLRVTFLDVGQGDATLIQTPNGRRVLVDGGQYPTRLNSHLGRLLPYGDRRLDLVVATHPDADHVAGLPEIIGRYQVGQILTNGTVVDGHSPYAALLDAAERENIPLAGVAPGQVIQLDEGVQLTVLHPGSSGGSDNDSSVVLRLSYGAFSLLLPGDSELAAEQAIVAGGAPLASLVLKAGHHGARTSSNDFFLAAVQPQVVVISSGAGNTAGHPHPEVLERAASRGAVVLRTDELGTITAISDGQQLWWESRR